MRQALSKQCLLRLVAGGAIPSPELPPQIAPQTGTPRAGSLDPLCWIHWNLTPEGIGVRAILIAAAIRDSCIQKCCFWHLDKEQGKELVHELEVRLGEAAFDLSHREFVKKGQLCVELLFAESRLSWISCDRQTPLIVAFNLKALAFALLCVIKARISSSRAVQIRTP